jgi:uncharacterized membrane protein (UPF0127 family)
VVIQFDEYTNDYFIEIPPDMCNAVDFKVGDTIIWEKKDEETWILRKKDERHLDP